MRGWIDVGIDANSNRRAQIFRARDAIDVFQLRFALNVETVHALIERVFDFLTRFAYAGEGAPGGIAARGEDAMKFAAGYDVEAGSRVTEQLEDRPIRVRFDSVTNQMIQRGERSIESCVMIENCPRAVDVKWRAKFVGHARKIDIFTVEAHVAIMKEMHVV